MMDLRENCGIRQDEIDRKKHEPKSPPYYRGQEASFDVFLRKDKQYIL
jgi:hypothetical protein